MTARATAADDAADDAETAFTLRTDHIALDALLKATGAAVSGGHAKLLIQGGDVTVDGIVEQRRACKLRAGQTVALSGRRIHVLGP